MSISRPSHGQDAFPDSVVASTVPVSSLPPCATTQSVGARERTEKLNSHQRTRYTHRPHLPRPLLIA